MKTNIMKPEHLMALLAFLLLAAMTLAASGQQNTMNRREATLNRGQLSGSDYQFAVQAARCNLLQVELGKLALQKSNDPQVRHFAHQMIHYHSQANENLKHVLASQSANMPQNLSLSQETELQKLNGLSGRDFDRAYMDYMKSEHQKVLTKFDNAKQSLQNTELRNYAADNSHVIQQHLNEVQNMPAPTR